MKFNISALLLSVVVALSLHGAQATIRLYNVRIENANQVAQIRKMIASPQVRSLYDIGPVGKNYEIGVESDFAAVFEKFLLTTKIGYKLILEDLYAAMPKIFPDELEWTQYHTLDSIYAWLDKLILKHFPNVMPIYIGNSYENRPIKGVRYSKGGLGLKKKSIILDSNIHAIEWISSAASTCFFDRLLNSNDPDLVHLRETYNWYLLPMLNPDGYVYTQEVNPLWRKNRKPTGFSNSSGICYGTDLNRNFDFKWKMNGYNVDVPCDHFYGGNSPASEPETESIQRFLNFVAKWDDARIYVAMHSYGNLILLPYGHTNDVLPSNFQQMMNISRGFADAARVKYGTDFIYGPSGQVLYPVSGAAKDYAYEISGIPYSVTLELRDRGEYGFFLPANQILEVCDEITDGFIGMVRTAELEGLFD